MNPSLRAQGRGAYRENGSFPAGSMPDEADLSLVGQFRRVVSACGNRVAILDSDSSLTYAELDSHSEELAAGLIGRLGVGPEPVALHFPIGVEGSIAQLGVLKARKFCVFIDPDAGEATSRRVLQDCSPRVVLTSADRMSEADRLRDLAEVHILDDLRRDHHGAVVDMPIEGGDIATLHYTSGTTGQPKGVVISHAARLGRTWGRSRDLGLRRSDRLAQLHSFAYAASSLAVFGALLNGAVLCPWDPRRRTPGELLQWLSARAISVVGLPLDLMREMARVSSRADYPVLTAVRYALLMGQSVTWGDIDLLRPCFGPDCKFINSYSSTESGNVAQYFLGGDKTGESRSTVPVGYVSSGVRVLILDDDLRPLGRGVSGQVAVSSPMLSMGYWKRPEQTAEKFIEHPLARPGSRMYLTGDIGRMGEGDLLELMGRMDSMVKVRGYRVELGAIERALADHSGIREAAVVALSRSVDRMAVIAYLVPDRLPGPTVTALRTHLLGSLPAHMLPDRFVTVPALPRTAAGKVARTALPAPGSERPRLAAAFVEATTETEAWLCHLWAELLQLDEVGIDDHFFELGGDSINAFRMLADVEAQLRQRVDSGFLTNPTVRNLAALVESAASAVGERITGEQVRGRIGDSGTLARPQSATATVDGSRRAAGPAVSDGRASDAQGPIAMSAANAVRQLVPYGIGVWLQRQLWSRPVLQRRFHAEAAETMRRWTELTVGRADVNERIARHLMANTWIQWRRVALGAERRRTAWVNVCGEEVLVRAADRGRGVVIGVPHYADSAWIRNVLRQHLSVLYRFAGAGGEADEFKRAVAHVTRLREAHDVLLQGGCVLIGADSDLGTGGVTRECYGGVLTFRPGAAELAVRTGAALVLAFWSLSLEGRMDVEFVELSLNGRSSETRVHDAVSQQAELLVERWPQIVPNLTIAAARVLLDAHQGLHQGVV
ncbi:MAG: AMP-binding protein [Chloroflexi bacterium]|nr:AMP-binding protein [Chloroflexota bacterium]